MRLIILFACAAVAVATPAMTPAYADVIHIDPGRSEPVAFKATAGSNDAVTIEKMESRANKELFLFEEQLSQVGDRPADGLLRYTVYGYPSNAFGDRLGLGGAPPAPI